MTKLPSRPWRMFLPLAAVLLLAMVWTIYWFVAKGRAEGRFTEERQKLAAQGLTLVCTEESWGGFPFHFEFTCTSPIVTLADRAEIRSKSVLLTALAYAPWQVVALIDGPSTVSAEGIVPTVAEHQRALAAVTFGADWKPKISAEVPALKVDGWGGAEKVMFHARPSAGGADVAISADKATYQPEGRPPLLIDRGDLLGSVSPDRVLTIENIAMEQGKVKYWGSGMMSLDEAHRPAGKIATQTNDLDGLFAIIGPHLEMTDEQKAGLRAMLGLLGSAAKAPLIAQSGMLYLGPFKIADLPPLY